MLNTDAVQQGQFNRRNAVQQAHSNLQAGGGLPLGKSCFALPGLHCAPGAPGHPLHTAHYSARTLCLQPALLPAMPLALRAAAAALIARSARSASCCVAAFVYCASALCEGESKGATQAGVRVDL